MKTLVEKINEGLKSHSTEKLVDAIKQIIGNKGEIDWYLINDTDAGTIELYMKDLWLFDDKSFESGKLANNEDSNKIMKLLKMYKYYITFIHDGDINSSYYKARPCIAIEPEYGGIDFTKYYLKKNRKNNIFYHITRTENVDNILKKGLRVKGGKPVEAGGYRYFSEKIFLIAKSKYIRNDIDELVEMLGLYDDDFSIIQINLGNHNIDLYWDVMDYDRSKNSRYLYTYENIPPQLLKIIEYDKLPK